MSNRNNVDEVYHIETPPFVRRIRREADRLCEYLRLYGDHIELDRRGYEDLESELGLRPDRIDVVIDFLEAVGEARTREGVGSVFVRIIRKCSPANKSTSAFRGTRRTERGVA